MSVLRAINKFYDNKERRGWTKGFALIDLHDTVLKSNYKSGYISKEFYPHAKETLQFMSKLPDICMIMYTCSHQKEINEYVKFFQEHEISFHYINENPEVPTDLNGYGCYDKKPYMNFLIDDKAGFFGDEDWLPILNFLKEKYPNIK